MNKKYNLYKYIEWVKLGAKIQIFNRGIVVENILKSSIRIIISFFLWKSIYANNTIINNRSFSEMLNYIILSGCISAIYVYPSIYFMSMEVKTGNIAYMLLKPIDYQMQFICKYIGILYPMTIISIIVAFLFSFFIFPIPMAKNSLYFFISIIISVMTVISFDFMLGILCFWTENSWGIASLKGIIISFFSGALIPLDFFPEKSQSLMINYSPFQGIIYTPIQIYQNFWTNKEFLNYFIGQSFWVLIFLAIGRYLFFKARKSVLINGG